MEQQPFRIVIIGGGIAGLAAAIGLRGSNREIIVLEKSQMLREVGALISLQPNASKIVTSWNIDEFLARREPLTDREFKILDIDGNLVNRIPLDFAKYGANRVVYHRQDLHSSLKEAATSTSLRGNPAVIHSSSEVVTIDSSEGVVTVKDGTQYSADLIICADGVRSASRSLLLGGAIETIPTGLSAYRLLIESDNLKAISDVEGLDFKDPVTTMIMGYDRRVIMGPGRGGKLFGMVALVPDEKMNETSASESWTTQGSLEKLLESFHDFPTWLKEIFSAAEDISLWQLRDIEPLQTWVNNRAILVGDASHAMLPTQGQGASQSIEDAEALQAFFQDISGRPSAEQINERLMKVFQARYERATLIQSYSRQQARPATNGTTKKIVLNTDEFMDYNCNYHGASSWLNDHKNTLNLTGSPIPTAS